MSTIKKRFGILQYKLCMFLVNRYFAGTKAKNFEIKRRLLRKAGFDIGEHTKVVGPVHCDVPVTIGKNCWIGKNFAVHGEGRVTIGDNCDFGPEVAILTGGHSIGSEDRRAGEGEIYEVVIENGVWIGARATILRNTKVSSGCVVTSCACVIHDTEKNTMVGGVPAKKIRGLNDDSLS